MSNVRTRCIDALRTRIAGISVVGRVVMPSSAAELRVDDVVSQGKCVVELYPLADTAAEPGRTNTEQTFTVQMVIHLPHPLFSAPLGWGTPWNHEAAADYVCGEIYKTYSGQTDADDPQLGGHAIDTTVTSFCGGLSVDEEFATLITMHVCDVRYRFAYGAPDQAV